MITSNIHLVENTREENIFLDLGFPCIGLPPISIVSHSLLHPTPPFFLHPWTQRKGSKGRERTDKRTRAREGKASHLIGLPTWHSTFEPSKCNFIHCLLTLCSLES